MNPTTWEKALLNVFAGTLKIYTTNTTQNMVVTEETTVRASRKWSPYIPYLLISNGGKFEFRLKSALKIVGLAPTIGNKHVSLNEQIHSEDYQKINSLGKADAGDQRL